MKVASLRLIAGSPSLIATVVGLAIAMLGLGAVNILFVPFLINELGASAAWAGPLEAAQTISMVVDTRNYLTHYDASLRAKALTGQPLDLVTERLRFLTAACLLRELGFTGQGVQEALSRVA